MNNRYTPQQAARRFGVTSQTLRNWEEAGKIAPASRTEGNRRFYTEEALTLIEASGLAKRSKEQEIIGAKVIAVINHKGGSAKTTSTVNLAGVFAAEYGKRVLVVDMDSQANSTMGLGFSPYNLSIKHQLFISDVLLPSGANGVRDAIIHTNIPNLDIIPSSLNLADIETQLLHSPAREGALARALSPLEKDYDIILIDCPPSLGLFTTNALWASDYVLVPVESANYAVAGLAAITKIVQTAQNLGRKVKIAGVFNTRVPAPLTNSAKDAIDMTKKIFANAYIDVQISNTVASERAVEEGAPMVISSPKHKVSDEYRTLAEEVLERVD